MRRRSAPCACNSETVAQTCWATLRPSANKQCSINSQFTVPCPKYFFRWSSGLDQLSYFNSTKLRWVSLIAFIYMTLYLSSTLSGASLPFFPAQPVPSMILLFRTGFEWMFHLHWYIILVLPLSNTYFITTAPSSCGDHQGSHGVY